MSAPPFRVRIAGSTPREEIEVRLAQTGDRIVVCQDVFILLLSDTQAASLREALSGARAAMLGTPKH